MIPSLTFAELTFWVLGWLVKRWTLDLRELISECSATSIDFCLRSWNNKQYNELKTILFSNYMSYLLYLLWRFVNWSISRNLKIQTRMVAFTFFAFSPITKTLSAFILVIKCSGACTIFFYNCNCWRIVIS